MSKKKKPKTLMEVFASDDSKYIGDWEYFCDLCDFDMWKVRRKGDRKFGNGLTVVNEESAKRLATILDAADGMAKAIDLVEGYGLTRALNVWDALSGYGECKPPK